jgi:hypothetical protein
MDTFEVDNYFGTGLLKKWNGHFCPAFTIKEIGDDYKGFHQCMKHIVGVGETTRWIKLELDKLLENEKSKLLDLLNSENERSNQRFKDYMNKSFMPSI